MFYFRFFIFFSWFVSVGALADSCPFSSEKYGEGVSTGYQTLSCRISVKADLLASNQYRHVTFSKEGQVQIASNFPGSTNSNSTGFRIYYIFPFKTEQKILSADSSHLSVEQMSGAVFEFDKLGKMSSPNLKMKVSAEINSKNKTGVEIESFSKGLVFDLGYRLGNTPVANLNTDVIVTDKNHHTCSFKNSLINKKISEYDVEFIYKTNKELYNFLLRRCPNLDISDLLIADLSAEMEKSMRVPSVGSAPKNEDNIGSDNLKRGSKEVDTSSLKPIEDSQKSENSSK